jgi:hypothetical protein
MTAAGDSSGIEMIWKEVTGTLRDDLLTAPMGVIRIKSTKDVRDLISRLTAQITKKCILPHPGRDKPYVDAIWVIQQLAEKDLDRVMVFRTERLFRIPVHDLYFTGSNLVLPRYISDLFDIRQMIWDLDEGEALAAFLLMEVKAYDPNVGKQSDIIVVGRDGSVRWVSRADVKFWEDHFAAFKKETKTLLKVASTELSCRGTFFPEYLKRLVASIKTLKKDQEHIRASRRKRIAAEAEALRKHTRRH